MTQAFNLSQLANKVNTSGQLDVATGVTGTQAVANGGTGQSTYTDGQLLIGNTTGNTLTKTTLTAGAGISVTNGSGAITIAATGGGQIQTQLFTAPGTWTKPASCTQVRVVVIGGGAGQASTSPPNTSPGGSSSFGSIASATGAPSAPGTSGTGTVSVGTALKTTSIASNNPGTTPLTTSINSVLGITGVSSVATTQITTIAYSTSSIYMAGSGPAQGGLAIAIAPVSSPQPVTVGAGSNSAGPGRPAGIGGAVLVEFVG